MAASQIPRVAFTTTALIAALSFTAGACGGEQDGNGSGQSGGSSDVSTPRAVWRDFVEGIQEGDFETACNVAGVNSIEEGAMEHMAQPFGPNDFPAWEQPTPRCGARLKQAHEETGYFDRAADPNISGLRCGESQYYSKIEVVPECLGTNSNQAEIQLLKIDGRWVLNDF